MKKKVVSLLVLVLALSLVFTGCAQPKTNLVLATGGTSGTYYPFGGAMAQIFNTKIENMNVTAQSTGASVENLRLIGKKEVELAIVQNDTLDYAYNGVGPFANEKIQNVRAIATLYPEVVQIVVSEKSGITSIADLKGKRFSVGAPGSGTEANAKQITGAYGLTFEDFNPFYLSFSESADQYKDQLIDGFLFTSGIPNAAIQDVGAQNKLVFLSLSDEIIASLTAEYAFLTAFTIPAGTYPGQDADVKTVAVKATLITGAEVPEQVIYNITKALFENQPALAQAHAKGAELNINKAVEGISVPFHPGAAKYLKEKGVLE